MNAKLTSNVPLCDLVGQFRELQPQLEDAVHRVLASGQVILGPEVEALEEEVANYCGVGHGIACSSGSDALLLSLVALGVGPGDEVILPTFTFFATAGAVARCGATPVFVDIDPATYNLDTFQVENRVTDRTRAIIPVHLYGQCADMERLWQVAERYDLPIVEDACQAIGADYQGKRAGSLGAMCSFSFYPTKNLGGFGDSGMVVTNDPEWAKYLKRLRVHGMEPRYHHHVLGWNARMDAVQAALLRVKLPYLDRWIEARRDAARRYDSLIENEHLGGFLQRPVSRSNRFHAFNQYVVRVANGQRDSLVRHLKAEGVSTEIYYPIPLHLQPCFKYLGHREGDFPASEDASRCVVAFPMFPEITEDQQAKVVRSCSSFLRQRTRMAA